jgi:hypothetical protein
MNPADRNNAADREIGQHWETQFCGMARAYGKVFTPHQFRRSGSAMFYGGAPDLDGKTRWTLPDITVWSAPGEHHEIKHKNADRSGCYGLERYRLDALVRFANTTGQKVYYTIHDWEMAGAHAAKEDVANDIDHWLVGDVAELSVGHTRQAPGWSYYGGEQRKVDIWYWTADPTRRRPWFRPLADVWGLVASSAA